MKLEWAKFKSEFSETLSALHRLAQAKNFTAPAFPLKPFINPEAALINESICECSLKSLQKQVAQAAEQRTKNPCVGGSNLKDHFPLAQIPPTSKTTLAPVEFPVNLFEL